MYCSKCGKNNDSANRFCDGCGARLGIGNPTPDPVPTNHATGNGDTATSKKQGLIYLWIFLAIVAVCAIVFGVKGIVKNNKAIELGEVHAMLLKDWDTEVDPYDSETQGLQLDFTVSELSINLYHNYKGQRRYNRFNDVLTYQYEVISPTCIKTWYKSDSPRYYNISFNDDYSVMYFEYNGETRVMYPHHVN